MHRMHVKGKGEESQNASLVSLGTPKDILCSRIHLQPSLRHNSSAPHLPLPSNPTFRRELLEAKMHQEKFLRYLNIARVEDNFNTLSSVHLRISSHLPWFGTRLTHPVPRQEGLEAQCSINFPTMSFAQAQSCAERNDVCTHWLSLAVFLASASLKAGVGPCITLMEALHEFILVLLLSHFFSVASTWYKCYYFSPYPIHTHILLNEAI